MVVIGIAGRFEYERSLALDGCGVEIRVDALTVRHNIGTTKKLRHLLSPSRVDKVELFARLSIRRANLFPKGG